MTDSRAAALRALLFASSAAGMLCAAPAVAGDTDGAEDPQSVTDPGSVNVVGQMPRHEPTSAAFVVPLVDTPRAVTVIPRAIIEQTGATSLQDLLRTSPGITLGAGEGGQPLADRPFIRGQSSGNNVFLDGIRDAGGQQREVFNLEQVEVVKGPDSVYSGRGSGGGSINLSSKTASLTDFTRLGLGGGTDGYQRHTVDLNRAIGDSAGLRLNLLLAEGDVPGRQAVDYRKWGVALAGAVGLGTATTVRAGYYHLDSDQLPDYGLPLFTKTGVRDTASGVLDVPYDSFYGLTARDYLTNTVDAFTLSTEHRISPTLTLRNVTRYAETLNDYVVTNPGDGGRIDTGGVALVGGVYWMKRGTKSRWNPAETLANVTDLFGTTTLGGMKHSFDLGLELSREDNTNASYTVTTTSGSACPAPLTGFDCTPVYAPRPDDAWTGTIVRNIAVSNRSESVGLYGFDSVELSARWLLNLGLRHDRYTVAGDTLPRGATVPVHDKGEWRFTNYQLGLVYKPTPNTSLYASWSTASTPPTVSAGDQNTSSGTGSGNLSTELLDPEESTSVELGAKASLFRQQLQLGAALFRTVRRHAQIQTGPGVYEQAGEAEVQGLELSVSGNITATWQVFGGYAWMDSELTRGAYDNANIGDPLANTPEHSVSLFTTWRVVPALSLGGGLYHVSNSFGGNQGGAGGGSNRIYAPAWTRVDLFAAYDISERATLQLNVQNAGDAAYVLRTNGVHHADVGPGRSATLALNLRF
jgi:catecholate siderophore receptor